MSVGRRPASQEWLNVLQTSAAVGSAWLFLFRVPDHLRSINRGEQIFNGTQINITGVTALNDVLNQATIHGFCGTCHDTPNVGNHSVKAPLNIGIANAGANSPQPSTFPDCRSSPCDAPVGRLRVRCLWSLTRAAR